MSAKRITLQLAAVSQIFVLVISSLGAASGRNKVRSPETVFSNPTSVAINTFAGTTAPNAAALYPSDITVSGMTGTVTRVAVTLRGITSPRMNDLDYLLVGPGNEKYIFLSDVGSTSVVEDFVATITDDAFGTFPNSGPFSGTFKPTSGDGVADTFPAPAPAGPYNQPSGSPSFASVYNGINPNGTWSLYVVDDQVVNADSINSGWSLDITTTGTASTIFTNPSVISVNDTMMPASPYGTQINVTGQTGVISNLKVTLTGLTHTRVADVDVLLVSPNGKGLILMSDTGGTAAVSGVDLTFDDTAATIIPAVTFGSGTYRPTDFTSEVRDTFPYPAPLRPYHGSNASLSNFNGYSPNGIWTLYIVDDNGTQAGTLSGGWSLDVTTSPAPPPPPLTCSAPSFTPSNYSTGTKPTNFVTADFNNDTKPDLAVANQNSNDISILLGNGDGTFAPQSTISVGTGPYSIVAGKFDAGTTWDLAVTNSASNTVSVLLGNGDGTFGSPTSINVGPTPLSIAMGDFNEDSNTDLAVANFGGFLTGTISILLGNGSGGFSAGANVQTRSGPAFVAVADLNSGDTHDDLVVADFGAGSVSTYFGTGTGTFNLSQHINTGNGPIWVDMTSLGGDAFPDFRVANYNNDSATTCQGNANGTFTCNNATVGQNPTSITNADFTGAGGIPTRAVALSGTNTIDTNFGTIAVGQNPNAVRAVDLNNDTKMDLVSANSGSNNVTVMLNQCAAASGNLFDFNGDRRTDYTVWRSQTSFWYDYNVSQFNFIAMLGRPTDKLVPADYNGDGKTDVAVYRAETSTWIVRDPDNNPVVFTDFGMTGDIPVPADYDGDGKADLAVFRPSNGHWYIRQSTDNADLDLHWGMTGDIPVPTDYDNDGKDDLAVFRPSVGDWYIFRSSDMMFQGMHWGMSGDKPVPGDWDSDGLADFAVFRPMDGAWYIFRTSDSGFTAMNWGLPTDIPVPGDYEGDGKFDFAVWRPSDRIFYVTKSSDGGQLFIPWGLPTDTPVASAFIP